LTNVIAVGATGTGKSYIVAALAEQTEPRS
jgi:DNA replication protein DnaC